MGHHELRQLATLIIVFDVKVGCLIFVLNDFDRQKIKEIEQEIQDLEAILKKHGASTVAKQDIGKEISKKKSRLKMYDYLSQFEINDRVTVPGQWGIGIVHSRCNHKSPFFVWVKWERRTSLISSHIEVLAKVG